MGTCRAPAASWLQQSQYRSIRLPASRDPGSAGSFRRGILRRLGESSFTPGDCGLAVHQGHQRAMNAAVIDQHDIDRRQTIENRRKLVENRNLLYWYERLYREQFAGISDFNN